MLDCVAREVAQRLSEPVGVGGHGDGRHLPELEISLGGEREAAPELRDERGQVDGPRAQEVGALGSGEHEQIVDQTGDPRDLVLQERLDALQLLGARVRVGGEHLELALHHGQGRPQLVRGVGDELALRLERGFETVEHVVERFGQHPDLAGAGLGGRHARPQVAAVDAGGQRSKPPQRRRYPTAHQVRRDQRQHQRDRRREQERARDARL